MPPEIEEPDDGAEDDKIFGDFLDKIGPEKFNAWLDKAITENPDRFKATASTPTTKTAEGLEGFLSARLEKAEAMGESLREALADALDLLTPEQRSTLRKSRQKGGGDDPPSPTPKKRNEPSNVPPQPQPVKKTGLGFLKRL